VVLYIMLLTSLNPHIDAVATIDHLVPRSTKGRLAKRLRSQHTAPAITRAVIRPGFPLKQDNG
jgi:hypothetical protein